MLFHANTSMDALQQFQSGLNQKANDVTGEDLWDYARGAR